MTVLLFLVCAAAMAAMIVSVLRQQTSLVPLRIEARHPQARRESGHG